MYNDNDKSQPSSEAERKEDCGDDEDEGGMVMRRGPEGTGGVFEVETRGVEASGDGDGWGCSV